MLNALDSPLVNRLRDDLVSGGSSASAGLFDASGVAPPTVVWAPVQDDMTSEPFDHLIGFWRARKGDRPWPAEAEIDPVDLRPALGRLLICEPIDDAADFRIRLYGSRLALEMGRDLTGTYISEFAPTSYITTFYLACYRAVVIRGEPLFTRHEPSLDAYAADIKRLLLPFGADGRITRIVTAVDSVPRLPLGRPAWARRP